MPDGACGRIRARDEFATEWRFRLTPAGEATRPLVPDVAYVAYVVLAETADADAVEVPALPPSLAVEILSPDDRADDVRDKIATYLAAGTLAVVILDPVTETAAVHDARGMRTFASPQILDHPAFAGLTLELARIFLR